MMHFTFFFPFVPFAAFGLFQSTDGTTPLPVKCRIVLDVSKEYYYIQSLEGQTLDSKDLNCRIVSKRVSGICNCTRLCHVHTYCKQIHHSEEGHYFQIR